ncbi:MAG: nucleoside hydrolase [Candidatus Pacebacteria bacterium]|nr:nucleoside hydrolase [Candidatus Paceibacterota bacterium]
MNKNLKIHLDTDFGGDIDDICALAFLLKSPGVEITGITTVVENGGKRAGQVKYTLKVANRENIPVKAGADNSGGFYPNYLGLPSEEKYWPEPITPLVNTIDEALELLKSSIEQGAKIVAIGPLTNLYLLDIKYPGILKQTEIFFMGGYVHPPRPGFPDWKNEWDFNKQIDVKSAKHVFANSNITLVQLPVTEETFITGADLEALKKSDSLGQLLAKQAEEWKKDEKMAEKYGDCENIPKDIINFQYDPLTAAVALGWDGVEIQEFPLVVEEKDKILHERIENAGKIFKVVTKVDGARFNKFWLEQVIKD